MYEHLKSLLVCTAAGLLSLSGCAKKMPAPEPIPAAGPIPLNNFVRAWATNLDVPAGDGIKEVHARDKSVFAYTKGGQVMVLSRDAGRLEWVAQIRKTDRQGMRPPIVLKDRVVIPTSSTLELFETTEGALVKAIPLKVASRSNAVGSGNSVFLGGDYEGAGRVVAMDVTRDYVNTVWSLMIPKGGLASTPALLDDALFIGGGDGNVYAVSTATREALWPLKDGVFKTEGPITGDVAADDTGVYVASTDSRLYCLNRGTGRLKWQYYAGHSLREGPVVTASQAYQPVPGIGIAVLAKGDGDFNRKPLWTAYGVDQYLAEDDKLVYLRRTSDKAIIAYDKQSGEERFENSRRDLIAFATNAKADGVIFAASKTNRIIAIKPVLKPGVVGEMVWNEIELDRTPDQALALSR